MKRLSLILFLLFISNLYSQWEAVSLNPETQMLKSIKCLDDSTVISVGYYQTILRSQDKGTTWSVVNFSRHFDILYDVAYNNQIIMAVGTNSLILKSEDKGLNWSNMELGFDKDLKSICFNDNYGIIVGVGGIILYSNNFGNNWEEILLDNQKNNLNQVDFINDSIALIVGDNGFISTLNIMTKKINILNWGIEKELFCFSMNPNGKIIIGGEDKIHIRTNIELKDFKLLDSDLIPDRIFSILYINDSLILSTIKLSTTQREAFSIDNGKTWKFGVYNGTPISSFDITPSRKYAYLCGRRGEIVRINLNHLPIDKKWGALDTTVHFDWENFNFRYLDGKDDKNIIAGDILSLYISSDSRFNFKEIFHEEGAFNIRDIKYLYNNNIVILSDSGYYIHYPTYKIYTYKSIIRVSYDQGKNFKTFEFFDDNFGFWEKLSFFHNYGIAYRKYNKYIGITTDAGITWQARELPDKMMPIILNALDNDIIYGIANDSLGNVVFVRIYNNFEYYNTNILPGSFFYHSDMDFINKDIGWSMYYYYTDSLAHIYKTIDGGKSWKIVLTKKVGGVEDNGFQDIDFYDNNFGAVLTYNSDVFVTVDGGNSWENIPMPSYSRVGELYISPLRNLYAVKTKEVWKLNLNTITSTPKIINIFFKNISIYPSPATNIIFLQFESEFQGIGKVSIYNLAGIKQKKFNCILSKNENNIPVDVSDLSAGVYFIVIKNNLQVWKSKFIKK